LGVSRIALVGIVLYLNVGNRLLRVALVPAPLWQPMPRLAALGVGQPDLVTVGRFAWLLLAVLVAAGLGVFTRTALLLAFGLMALEEAMLKSFRVIDFSVESPPTHLPAIDARSRCQSMHLVDGRGRVTAGSDAFRRLAWVLPAAWPILPMLYLPGVAPVARRAYAFVAARRRVDQCMLHAQAP
jgi:hypothetical protein